MGWLGLGGRNEAQSPFCWVFFPRASVSQAVSQGRELEGLGLLFHFWGALSGINPTELLGLALPQLLCPPPRPHRLISFGTGGREATVTPGPRLLASVLTEPPSPPPPGVGLTAGKQKEGAGAREQVGKEG